MKLLVTIPAIAALLMGSVAMAEEPKADETKEEVVPGILRPLTPKANENSVIQKQGKPAWMILSLGSVGFADSSHIREFSSMDECERIAEHISMIKTPLGNLFGSSKSTGTSTATAIAVAEPPPTSPSSQVPTTQANATTTSRLPGRS